MQPFTVTRSLTLDASPDQVWPLVADEEGLAGWFGGDVQLDMRPGGAGRFTDDSGHVRRAVVADVQTERSVGWIWWDEDEPAAASSVELRVDSTEDGRSTVTVTETAVGGGRACTLADARIGSAWEDRLGRVEERFATLVGAGLVGAGPGW